MRSNHWLWILPLILVTSVHAESPYKPTWESLDARPSPEWYDQAKFGIFIHWGVYSVPAWGPKGKYAEWYWNDMQNPKGETWKFHARTYGEKFKYQDFAPMFKAEMFEPDQWAALFVRAGAKYVVLTSKHHEGFCLWPSEQSWNWNSVDVGPHRDLCGDLTTAVKKAGLKMGFYYSIYEWFSPLYKKDPKRYALEHMMPQIKDLVTRYEPSIVWTDGEWDHPDDVWHSCDFLAWLFNESPVKSEVVVNDRWGKATRGKHGGFYTTEYGQYNPTQVGPQHKWEENRGLGGSFGYNRNETIDEYKPATAHIHTLIETVAAGGNLLLDIGPTADGRVPVIMQQRLVEIGDWLKVNGEAIYSTRPWRQMGEGKNVYYTSTKDALYAICRNWPGSELMLEAPKAGADTKATLLGYAEPLKVTTDGGKMKIQLPCLAPGQLHHAYVIKLQGAQ